MATTTPEASFHCKAAGDGLLFRRMQGSEELGRLSQYRVELLQLQESKPVKFDQLLGSSATIKLLLTGGEYRYINAWITAVELGGAIGRFDVVRLEMRPWLWHLTLGSDCRIFQEMTAVEVLDEVFSAYKSAPLEKKLSGSFAKRPYCVQYRESDFDFVSRLMEEEGIHYYFKHADGKHTLVLCNSSSGHVAMDPAKLAWAIVQEDDQLRDDVITQWRLVQQMGSLKFTHTDFDHETPATSLLATAQRTVKYPTPGKLEIYDFPGIYANPGDATNATKGKDGAKQEVDRFESGQVIGSAATPCRSVAAGLTFGFKDHRDAGDYLITALNFEMDRGDLEATDKDMGEGFSARLTMVPKAAPYVSPAVTPRPLVHGPQTAVVVGPAGDELHTDKFGRVKVQFHWDRLGKKDAKSSCFVRVSSPWASKQFGMIALPRIGDEVVVEFMEGNPDRPLITGRVYNGDNMPPYELPAQATVSGIKSRSSKSGAATNFNELRFDDNKGSEYVWFQAEKDHHHNVKNDAFATIGQHNQLDIKKNNTVNIGEAFAMTVGKNTSLKIGGDASTDITGDLNMAIAAALGLKTAAAIAVKGGAAIAVTAAAAIDVNAGADANLTAGAAMAIKASAGITIDGGMKISIKAGAGWITLGPDGVSMGGPLVKINSGGSGSSAKAAKKASPTAPKAPAKVVAKKDPLAK